MSASNWYTSKFLVSIGLFLIISCATNRRIVGAEGSYYRLFSSPANGEKKLFIRVSLPELNPTPPERVLVNGESVPFETITNHPEIEVFISEFMQPKNAEEKKQRDLFLRLAAADEINVKIEYPAELLIYKNIPKQVSEQLELMTPPH